MARGSAMPEIETESPGTSGPVSPNRYHGQEEAKGASTDGDGTGGSSEGSVADPPSRPIRLQPGVEEPRGADDGPGAVTTLWSAIELVCGETLSDQQVRVKERFEASAFIWWRVSVLAYYVVSLRFVVRSQPRFFKDEQKPLKVFKHDQCFSFKVALGVVSITVMGRSGQEHRCRRGTLSIVSSVLYCALEKPPKVLKLLLAERTCVNPFVIHRS